ncbi:MAG: 4-hydroxy-tetrahydrodipicolinate reductase [Anaerovoracaceae bacterium]|jgi:4-hydroxy-tetrahydrodipicolinate reductase|nr:4-hydroxy-tetrahydrodipicolinate reductase [Bacillota bacterium]MDY2670014.1 4-hydroxy-tetrahydrodipicolinate reductase [Anaerovoracaceae bacterium]
MLNIILNGSNGRMGQVLTRLIGERDDMKVVAGVSKSGEQLSDFPVYSAPDQIKESADVIIDFSNFSAVPAIVDWAAANKTPIVIATTALDDDCSAKIAEAAKVIPVFKSANMSLGINALIKALKAVTPALEADFNAEIIEKHHNKKLDSPSGTAVMLADTIKESSSREKHYIYGRHSKHDEFSMDNIGIHAVRGGTIPGIHTVMYCGPDETLEFTHTAFSRDIFGNGAIKAAEFIAGGVKPGMYSMDDII